MILKEIIGEFIGAKSTGEFDSVPPEVRAVGEERITGILTSVQTIGRIDAISLFREETEAAEKAHLAETITAQTTEVESASTNVVEFPDRSENQPSISEENDIERARRLVEAA